MSGIELKTTVSIDQLFLSIDNPRHEEVDTEMEAIERLCRTENIDAIARDIARHGMDPTARLIVFPRDEDIDPSTIDAKTDFIVAEGNRRVCALKLLHDPDNAPAKIRATIEKASANWVDPVEEVDVVVITDRDRRRHWLSRIHNGVQGGVGRKPWSSEQKTRFAGTKRNVIAQALFDYAEREGMFSAADRKGAFSHMARLIGNVLMADTLGIDTSNGLEDVMRNRPKDVFDLVLKEVLKEAKSKSLGSQAKKLKIDGLAQKIQMMEGFRTERIKPPEPLEGVPGPTGKGGGGKPRGGGVGPTDDDKPKPPTPPKKPENVRQEQGIHEGLQELGSDKLQSLYYSICWLTVSHHTPLIAVGTWAFFESLTALAGRIDGVPFIDYLNKGRLSGWGVGRGKELNGPVEAVKRISSHGNVTKHHGTAASFDAPQLINDMKTLTPVILACIEEAKKNG